MVDEAPLGFLVEALVLVAAPALTVAPFVLVPTPNSTVSALVLVAAPPLRVAASALTFGAASLTFSVPPMRRRAQTNQSFPTT